MPSRDVEFRMLHLVANVVGDERITVGLVHWDGRELRFAWGAQRVPRSLTAAVDVRSVVSAVAAEAATRSSDLSLDLGLDQMFDVRPGEGSLVAWGPRRIGSTQDGASHFRALVESLHLRETPQGRLLAPLHPSVPKLDARLTTLGNELIAASTRPDRIATLREVEGLRPYRSPLSWMNGRWHHSFPVRFDDAADLVTKFEKTLGKIDVSLPGDDVGVIVMAHPSSPSIARHVRDATAFVRERQKGRVDCVAAPLKKGTPNLAPLRERIETDVAATARRSR